VLAGEQLGMVERDCKGILKRLCRQERIRVDQATISSGEGGIRSKDDAGERPGPTPITEGDLNISSMSTNTTTSTGSAGSVGSSGDSTKYESRQRTITTFRIEALRLLGEVEEMQGRPERRGRWDSLAIRLEAG
jgi:hypothetical protein